MMMETLGSSERSVLTEPHGVVKITHLFKYEICPCNDREHL
jgi:hypothetical protein